MVLQRSSWAKIRPEGNWPLWQFHSGSACPWPFGCSHRLPRRHSSCRGTRHTHTRRQSAASRHANQLHFQICGKIKSVCVLLADSPVLHNPVVLFVLVSALKSVTHQQHAVVQLLAAAVLVKVDSWRAQDLVRPQTSKILGRKYEMS